MGRVETASTCGMAYLVKIGLLDSLNLLHFAFWPVRLSHRHSKVRWKFVFGEGIHFCCWYRRVIFRFDVMFFDTPCFGDAWDAHFFWCVRFFGRRVVRYGIRLSFNLNWLIDFQIVFRWVVHSKLSVLYQRGFTLLLVSFWSRTSYECSTLFSHSWFKHPLFSFLSPQTQCVGLRFVPFSAHFVIHRLAGWQKSEMSWVEHWHLWLFISLEFIISNI